MSPRALPTGVATAAALDPYRAGYAFELLTPSPIRVTDLPQGVTIGGNVYTYGLLAMGQWEINDNPTVEVQLSNADNAVSSVDLDGTPRGALERVAATLYEVIWSGAGAQLGEDELLGGAVVVGCTYGGLVARVTLAHKATSDAGRVGVFCSRYSCPYTFGSPSARALGMGGLCGYAGAQTWCDHTRARCVVLANQARFGAMRIMPTLNSRISYSVVTPGIASQRFGIALGPQQPNPTVLPVPLPTPPHGPPKFVEPPGFRNPPQWKPEVS